MHAPKIVLTDYPKTKRIEANYRGIETDVLVEMRKKMFHIMMEWTVEVHGGYAIMFEGKGIERELNYRNVELERL